MRGLLMLLALALVTAPASARIYKWVLPDGSITYSDKPQEGAEQVELSPLQTYSAPPAPAPAEGGAEAAGKGAAPGYDAFAVASPADDAVIRDSGGEVSISLNLQPGLRSGHEIEILMDGQALGKGRATSITLTNVDRGSHQVAATVLDDAGKVVARTDPITFHLKRGAR